MSVGEKRNLENEGRIDAQIALGDDFSDFGEPADDLFGGGVADDGGLLWVVNDDVGRDPAGERGGERTTPPARVERRPTPAGPRPTPTQRTQLALV